MLGARAPSSVVSAATAGGVYVGDGETAAQPSRRYQMELELHRQLWRLVFSLPPGVGKEAAAKPAPLGGRFKIPSWFGMGREGSARVWIRPAPHLSLKNSRMPRAMRGGRWTGSSRVFVA